MILSHQSTNFLITPRICSNHLETVSLSLARSRARSLSLSFSLSHYLFIYFRFLYNHVHDLHDHVLKLPMKRQIKEWQKIQDSVSNQVLLRVVSCCQIASKLTSHYKVGFKDHSCIVKCMRLLRQSKIWYLIPLVKHIGFDKFTCVLIWPSLNRTKKIYYISKQHLLRVPVIAPRLVQFGKCSKTCIYSLKYIIISNCPSLSAFHRLINWS